MKDGQWPSRAGAKTGASLSILGMVRFMFHKPNILIHGTQYKFMGLKYIFFRAIKAQWFYKIRKNKSAFLP